MQKITPFLWFDGQAEEAMKFYTSLIKNSKTGHVARMPEGGPGPAGQVLTASFELEGLQFTALNGGPMFKFTEATSFHVSCETQDEVDYYWDRLSAGGSVQMCGWVKDKFGLSWQIVPVQLQQLLGSPDKARAQRAMQAMLQMKKIVIADLEQAANG